MSTIPGLLLLIFLLVGVTGTVFWIIALVDALRFTDAEWTAAGQNKLVYVLVLIFLGFIGALVYWFVARPELVKRAPAVTT